LTFDRNLRHSALHSKRVWGWNWVSGEGSSSPYLRLASGGPRATSPPENLLPWIPAATRPHVHRAIGAGGNVVVSLGDFLQVYEHAILNERRVNSPIDSIVRTRILFALGSAYQPAAILRGSQRILPEMWEARGIAKAIPFAGLVKSCAYAAYLRCASEFDGHAVRESTPLGDILGVS